MGRRSGFIVLGLAVASWLADPASAQEGPPRAAAASIILISATLKDGNIVLGELPMMIKGDEPVAVERAALVRLTKPVLKPETLAKLSALPVEKDYVAIAAIRAAGLSIVFNGSEMAFSLEPTVDQRPRRALRLAPVEEAAMPEGLEKPAAVSGYLNLHAGAQYASSGLGRQSTASLGMDGALRILDGVLENEAVLSTEGYRRQGTRFVYDDEMRARRLVAGDISPRTVGMQNGVGLAGVTIEQSYAALQPQKNIRPTGLRSFRLERPSEVAIIVNGQVMRRLQMQPGDYDLSDLPLKTGENRITLEITDDTGKRSKLDFTIPYDHTLLAPGISEWAFSAGLRSEPTLAGTAYDTRLAGASAFYRVGLTETLTGTVHAQVDPRIAMGGTQFAYRSPIGGVSLEVAGSRNATGAPGGAMAVGLGTETLFEKLGLEGGLRIGLDARTREFTPFMATSALNPVLFNANMAYATPLTDEFMLSLTGGYTLRAGQEDSVGGEIALTKVIRPDASWSLSAAYDSRADSAMPAQIGRIAVLAHLNIGLGERSTLSFRQEGKRGRSILEASTEGAAAEGRYAGKVRILREPPAASGEDTRVSLEGAASYSGPMGEFAFSNSRRVFRAGGSAPAELTTVSASGAIAFADGAFAIGHPINDSFAILERHESLRDAGLRVGMNDEVVRGSSSFLGDVLVPDLSSYSPAQLPVRLDNAPEGYDLGSGVFDLRPRRRDGYRLKVGSEYSVVVSGVAVAKSGEPVRLVSGLATEMADKNPRKIMLFTNDEGRFSAQGLRPGVWKLEFLSDPETCFELRVPEKTVGVLDAGSLKEGCPA